MELDATLRRREAPADFHGPLIPLCLPRPYFPPPFLRRGDTAVQALPP
jgi:hypothetical protein